MSELVERLGYGQPIPRVAQKIQETVARRAEEMTGLRVSGVDVYVQELQLPRERLGSYSLEFIYWLVLLYLILLSIILVALGLGAIDGRFLAGLAARPWGRGLLYSFAGLSFVAGSHLLNLILRLHRSRTLFRQEGRGGTMLIPAGALRKLVRERLGPQAEGARLRLVPHREGMDVIVELKRLPPGESWMDAAARMQGLLRQQLERETGIKLNRVQALIRNPDRKRNLPARKGDTDETI